MKANNKFLDSDTNAQVGIGTLIIFIAMVLVAAVAAAVLIQTSGTLQQKAQSTGKQATQEVSSNLMIKSIEGIRASSSATNMSANISMLELKVGLNVGSSPVDVNQVVISITDGTTTNNLIYANNAQTYGTAMQDFNESASGATNTNKMLTTTTADAGGASSKYFFTTDKIRDEDGSFTQGEPVMNTGDLVTFYLSTVATGDTAFTDIGTQSVGTQTSTGLVIAPRTSVSIVFTPESGAATTAEFITPSSYGTKANVILYP